MSEHRSNRYLGLLLDALRSSDPKPMRPAEAVAWIRSRTEIPAEHLTRTVKNSKQTIFESDVAFARMTLVPLGLIDASKRGLWSLTPKGRETHIDASNADKLIHESRAHFRKRRDEPDDDTALPFEDDGVAYWFVGTKWNERGDQLPRFREEGIWENGYSDQYLEHVKRMRPGDRIAAKATFTTKRVPFNVGGKVVSAMAIRATGTVLENLNDGRRVKVAWDPPRPQRLWYFYTYRVTIVEADKSSDDGRALIAFTFEGAKQDHNIWLQRPYWIAKYGVSTGGDATADPPEEPDDGGIEVDDPSYTTKDIIEDGCFMSEAELNDILARWRAKKNVILQGPPGTGKTWLAKRLGFALLGTRDSETSRSRLRVVQFHPSLAYEDFVRGLRPNQDGRLELIDGIFMEAITAAAMEPDKPFILVIEEINRGNPAQIFGEMLTLLESSKRRSAEAVELAYRRAPGERVHVPDNLYVIGTMNIADRSLAIVDLALRRRFGFVDLEPRFGEAWRGWCVERGIPQPLTHEIERRVLTLNEAIAAAPTLGSQFRIGHSYVTPDQPITGDATAWFRHLVNTEIGPLLDEYWFDAPSTARSARADLLKGL